MHRPQTSLGASNFFSYAALGGVWCPGQKSYAVSAQGEQKAVALSFDSAAATRLWDKRQPRSYGLNLKSYYYITYPGVQ